jgi:hypothetical protein
MNNIRENFKASKISNNSNFNINLSSFSINGISSVNPNRIISANQESLLVLNKLIKSGQLMNFAKMAENTGKKWFF